MGKGKFKRYLSLGLSFACLSTMLSGCGGNQSNITETAAPAENATATPAETVTVEPTA